MSAVIQADGNELANPCPGHAQPYIVLDTGQAHGIDGLQRFQGCRRKKAGIDVRQEFSEVTNIVFRVEQAWTFLSRGAVSEKLHENVSSIIKGLRAWAMPGACLSSGIFELPDVESMHAG